MQAWIFKDIQGVYLHYKDYIEPIWMVIGNESWDMLDPIDQQAITDAAQQVQNEQSGKVEAMDEKYMQMLRDYGWTVLVPTDAEWKNMQAVVFAEVWPKLTPIIGTDIINGLYDALGIPLPG